MHITFTFERLWRAFFWSGRQFSHPLRRLHIFFNIVAVHPSFITCDDIFQKVFISIRTIKQLLTDCDTVLFLCICRLSVKIWWQLLRQLHGQLGNNFGESKQALSQCDRCPLMWKAKWVVFDGRSAWFETLVPLVTLRMAQTILSISLLQHLKSLHKSFTQYETEFDANTLLLKILHVSTCKKWPRVLNTHSIKRTSLDE